MFTNTPVGGKRERQNGAHPAWSTLGANSAQIHQNTADLASKMHKLRYTKIRSPPTRVSIESITPKQRFPAPNFEQAYHSNIRYEQEESDNEEFENVVKNGHEASTNVFYESDGDDEEFVNEEYENSIDEESDDEGYSLNEDTTATNASFRYPMNQRSTRKSQFYSSKFKPLLWFGITLFSTLLIITLLHKGQEFYSRSFSSDNSQPSNSPVPNIPPASNDTKTSLKPDIIKDFTDSPSKVGGNEEFDYSAGDLITKKEFDEILQQKVEQLKQSLKEEMSNYKSSVPFEVELNDDWKFFIESTVRKYLTDPVSMPNFALLSTGAEVLPALTSKRYVRRPSAFIPRFTSYFFDSLVVRGHEPSIALTPNNAVAMCWSFQGSEGQLGISLSRPVYVTNVTIEHVQHKIAHDLSSAPKDFELWVQGMSSKMFVLLGKARYALTEDSIQTFSFEPSNYIVAEPIQNVILKIKSNWGNPNYTCLYQVRVHGTVPNADEQPIPSLGEKAESTAENTGQDSS